jgi:hypothetical protein
MSKYSPDTPLRLDVALREAFPAGGMTVSANFSAPFAFECPDA